MSLAGSNLTINECIGKTFNFSTGSKNIVFKVVGYTSSLNYFYIELQNGDIVRRKIYLNSPGGYYIEGSSTFYIREKNEWCYLRSGRIVEMGGLPINNNQLDAEYTE